jgi:hypothetical protein
MHHTTFCSNEYEQQLSMFGFLEPRDQNSGERWAERCSERPQAVGEGAGQVEQPQHHRLYHRRLLDNLRRTQIHQASTKLGKRSAKLPEEM